ncbi:MAG: NADH-quinone oxidoreductase subunit NuoN [Rhodospirillaceae bacterium]
MNQIPTILPAAPVIFLAASALGLLMFGVFRGDGATRIVSYLASALLLVTVALVIGQGGARQVAFNGLFVMDGFAVFMDTLVLIGTAAVILSGQSYNSREKLHRSEYPILMMLAATGMLMMISANDLMSLYMGMETQSLALYVLAASRRDVGTSSEAGLKYFVLGALASGLLLFGASLIYGFTGSTNFDKIAHGLAQEHRAGAGVVIGMVFMAAGLAFKVAAVPFHMWAPDVYEGSPTPVTAFFAVAPKVAAVALFLRVLMDPFGSMGEQWRQIIMFMSVASMLIGSLGAIQQTNIKRLMAYGSIGHIGYLLLGLSSGGEQGVRGILVYLAVYVVMSVGAFAVILSMRHQGRMVDDLAHFAGLSRTHPLLAVVMAIFMFSMAGVPPLAGFFGKMYVFLAAVEAHLYGLAVIGVLTSVVAAYYYLRVIKLMYFDETSAEPIDRQDDPRLTYVLAATAVFTLMFFIFPVPILNGAATAAASLFPG